MTLPRLCLALVAALACAVPAAPVAAQPAPSEAAPARVEVTPETDYELPAQRAEITPYSRKYLGAAGLFVQLFTDRRAPIDVTAFGCDGAPYKTVTRRKPDQRGSWHVSFLPKDTTWLGGFSRVDVTFRNPEGPVTLSYGSNVFDEPDRRYLDKRCRFGVPPRLFLDSDEYAYYNDQDTFTARATLQRVTPGTEVSFERWIPEEQRWAPEVTTTYTGGESTSDVELPTYRLPRSLYRACVPAPTGGPLACSWPMENVQLDGPTPEDPDAGGDGSGGETPEPRRSFTAEEEQTWVAAAMRVLNDYRADNGLSAMTLDTAMSERTASLARCVYEAGDPVNCPNRPTTMASGRKLTNYAATPSTRVPWLLEPSITSIGLSVFWDEDGGFEGSYLAYAYAKPE